jgi:radical SAM protein with 4Fe4S-binding SPASM domain
MTLGARYLPAHINLETSDYCNRSCAYCPVQAERDSAPPRLMDEALFDRVIDELASWERPLTISLQWIDEPLANPRFLDMAERAVLRLPHARWVLQTNGDLLTADIAARMKPLFHAVVVNLYARSAARRVDKLDLDIVRALGPARVQHPGRLRRPKGAPAGEALFHFNHKYRTDHWIDWKDARRRDDDDWCSAVFEQVAIGWDGRVFACCRDNLKAHPIGDLRERSLASAYNSSSARALRRKMLAGQRAQIAMCRDCDKAFKRPFVVEGAGEGGLVPTGDGLPFGHYDYESARALARGLGHLELPGFLPRRYERVVGLTRALAAGIVGTLGSVLGDALHCVWVCGGRVMTRRRLALVDPSVFMPPTGTLEVGKKGHLREYGRDPMLSSDLDLKVFVDDDVKLDDVDAVELALGAALEDLGAPFPISGNPTPRVRLLPASRSATPREAFAAYNARRPETLRKGPLSLEYTQLLADRAGLVRGDPTADVRAQLREGGRPVALGELTLSPDDEARPDWSCFEAGPGAASGLSYHQLIGALQDFPGLDPADVALDARGRVTRGGLSVRAARAAGRSHIRV